MISIGWRNLKCDPMRAGVAIFGVVLAVTLVTVEVGMMLGLVRNASQLIDDSGADLWISKVDVKTFDFGTPFDQRKGERIKAIPGVASVEEFNVSFSIWRLPTGGNTNCEIVAIDEHGTLAPKLNLVSGSIEALHNQDAIIIDEGDRAKLGYPNLGESIEIVDRRAKIVGFTRNMRSFTTTPYVFTSLRRGDRYGYLTAGGQKSIYLLVKVAPGASIEGVRATIGAAIPGVEVHTRSSFSWRTRCYWLIETGVGLGFLVAACLGLLVGCVIVSQMLYAMTLDKLPEFGVLKAMGASMQDLSRVVLEQGLICGGVGLVIGLLFSWGAALSAQAAGTAVELTPVLIGSVVLMTVGLSCSAALFSIQRLRRIEPGMVFRT